MVDPTNVKPRRFMSSRSRGTNDKEKTAETAETAETAAVNHQFTNSPIHQFTNYAYAAPTMIFLILMYGEPCEMLLVCVG
jgi:hypothetical protein